MPIGDGELRLDGGRSVAAEGEGDTALELDRPEMGRAGVLEGAGELVEFDAGAAAGRAAQVECLRRTEVRSRAPQLQAILGDTHIVERNAAAAPARRQAQLR